MNEIITATDLLRLATAGHLSQEQALTFICELARLNVPTLEEAERQRLAAVVASIKQERAHGRSTFDPGQPPPFNPAQACPPREQEEEQTTIGDS